MTRTSHNRHHRCLCRLFAISVHLDVGVKKIRMSSEKVEERIRDVLLMLWNLAKEEMI